MCEGRIKSPIQVREKNIKQIKNLNQMIKIAGSELLQLLVCGRE